MKGLIFLMDSAKSAESAAVKPRIAIPEPCSYDLEYSGRALPAYLQAIAAAGGEPVVVPLKSSPEDIAKIATSCAAILLPGSKADVDPQKYNAKKHPATNPADQLRDSADELLLQDAYNLHKPVFGICYGLQSLNVWRSGTLVQHIESKVNHEAGSKVEIAHKIIVEPDSLLGRDILRGRAETAVPVNSSHHQSADVIGDGLRTVAYSPEDHVAEAIEGTAPDHYVVAVQWHPERTFAKDQISGSLFHSFVQAAKQWFNRPPSQ